jgi:hypothetical protein
MLDGRQHRGGFTVELGRLGEQRLMFLAQRGDLGGVLFVDLLGDVRQVLIRFAFDVGDLAVEIVVTITSNLRLEDCFQDSGVQRLGAGRTRPRAFSGSL